MLQLLKLILACKLIKVAIRAAYLIPMRCISRCPVIVLLLFTVSIEDVLPRVLVQSYPITPLVITNIHQFLHKLLLCDLLAVNQLLQEQVQLLNIICICAITMGTISLTPFVWHILDA